MFQSMRYIYEIYREKSFSRAAKNLYISQPTLSAAVKKEESEIGFPLFDRSTNPISLTEYGRQYIRSAEVIMDAENSFTNYIHDLSELKSGSLVLGGTNFFLSCVLPPLLYRFTQKYPHIHVELMEGTTGELTEKLNTGAIDFLLDYSLLDSDSYVCKSLVEEHLLLAVPASFSSNDRVKQYALTASDIRSGRHIGEDTPPVSLRYFRGDPFLLLQDGNDTRERGLQLCRKEQIFPNIRLELAQQITAYNLSRYRIGISFVGDLLIQTVPEDQELLFYKLAGEEAIRNVHLYYKRNRYLTNAMSAFLEIADGQPIILPAAASANSIGNGRTIRG